MTRFATFYLVFQTSIALAQSHWNIVARDSAGFDDIHFISQDTGFVVGTNSLAWRTIDGGTTWDQMVLPNDVTQNNCELISLSFPNDRIGYIGGVKVNSDSAVLLRTTNAGDSWEHLPFTPSYPVSRIDFPTPSIGYLTMGYLDSGFIGKSIDSGTTWSLDTAPSNSGYLDVKFRDNAHGIFRERDPAQSMTIQEWINITSNGLQSWTKTRAYGSNYYEAISPVMDQIWCVAGGTSIQRSTDDGITWTQPFTEFRYGEYIVGLTFHDSIGYAITGHLIKSTDAGLTWDYQSILDSTAAYYGTILNDSVAYLLCLGPNIPYVILKTTDGGGPILSNGVTAFQPSNKFAISPNPTSGVVYVRGSVGSLSVENMLGEEVLRTNSPTFDLSNKPSGTYYVRSGAQAAKIIVAH